MIKNGFVAAFIIILALIASGLYLGYTNYSKEPNPKTREIAKTFLKYPNATSWLIVHRESICIYYFDGCQETPSTITFTTGDGWAIIFDYYKSSLEKFGWTTNTKIVTSIPQQINFTGYFEQSKCEAALIKPKEGKTEYKFSIICRN